MNIQIKRIYDPPGDDGKRFLVDRLWPRGISKEKAGLDGWMKDAAPTPELRKWFGHQPERFEEFKWLYTEELAKRPEQRKAVELLCEEARVGKVTLVYAAKDPVHNHAVILRDWIEQQPCGGEDIPNHDTADQ